MTTVEVHVVSYNSADLIVACLGSLLEHRPTAPDVEMSVVVLDNASTDGTADVVEREFGDAVRLVRGSTNTLYGPASNALVAASTADLVLMLNPDTFLDADAVTPLVRALERHPEADVAYPTLVDPAGRPQAFAQTFPDLTYEWALQVRGTKLARALRPVWDATDVVTRRRDTAPAADVVLPMAFVWSTAWLVRREVAQRFGPFADTFPMYDTDLDLCRRMATAGLSSVYVADAVVAHVGGASSRPEAKVVMEQTARARYYRTHHGALYGTTYAATAKAWPLLQQTKRRLLRR